MARVTGVARPFFKPEKDNAEDKGLTVWNVAARDIKWFSPSDSSFMINYRVDDWTGCSNRSAGAG